MFGDDDDATVPDIDMDADEDEAWRAIDDDLSDEDTVSDGGHQDNELDESAFKDIRDNVSEMASEDEPVEEGPGEEPYNIGGHVLRNRDKVKKRDFGLHLSVEAASYTEAWQERCEVYS